MRMRMRTMYQLQSWEELYNSTRTPRQYHDVALEGGKLSAMLLLTQSQVIVFLAVIKLIVPVISDCTG